MAESAPRSKHWKWWVCGLLLLASMFLYMDRQTLGNVSARLLWEFDLTNEQYGNLGFAFGIAFACGGLTFGFIADRFGVYWLYPFVLTGWSVAGFATGFAETYQDFMNCRIALGFFEAGHWPCAMKTVQLLLPRADRGMGNSVLQSGASVGAVATPIIMVLMLASFSSGAWMLMNTRLDANATDAETTAEVSSLLHEQSYFKTRANEKKVEEVVAEIRARKSADSNLTAAEAAGIIDKDKQQKEQYIPGAWRPPFFIIGAAGISWVLLWLVTMRRRDLDPANAAEPEPTGTPLWDVIKDRRFIILLAIGACINTPWQLIREWLVLLLIHRGYTEKFAQLFNSAYYIATDIGCLLAGAATLWLAKRGATVHQSRVRVFGVCAALIALTTVAAYLPKGWLLLGVLLIIAGASLGVFPIAYAMKQDLAREHMGKITGLVGASAWLTSAPMQKVFGWLRDTTGSFKIGLAVVGWLPLIAFALIIFCWPKDKTAD
jgi:MFS family permease